MFEEVAVALAVSKKGDDNGAHRPRAGFYRNQNVSFCE